MADLAGKTIVVTGASKGIGAAIASAAVRAGARVIAHYGSDRAGAEAAVAGAAPGQAVLVQADFTDKVGVDAFWGAALAAVDGRIDGLMRHAVRGWLKAGTPGAIVGIGSWVTTRGTSNPGAIAYAASKAAIVAATKTVARNYADRGILAYVISLGVVRTRMSVDSAAKVGGEAAVTASLPMGEWIPPEDIAEVAIFLAEGRARHLTGTTIDINGAAYIR